MYITTLAHLHIIHIYLFVEWIDELKLIFITNLNYSYPGDNLLKKKLE